MQVSKDISIFVALFQKYIFSIFSIDSTYVQCYLHIEYSIKLCDHIKTNQYFKDT